MPDNIIRIGAEMDVSPIIAGSNAASASVTKMVDDISAQAAKLRSQGLTGADLREGLIALGNSAGEVDAALKKTADTVDKSTGSMGNFRMTSAMARGEMAAMTGSAGGMEFAFARLAASSEALVPLIRAAFAPLALVGFVEILRMAYDGIAKLTEGMAGYTKAVQKAYEEDVKFSDAALGHAQTLAEAHSKLSQVIRAQGDIAKESFGEKWKSATQDAIGTIPEWHRVLGIAPFEAAVGAVRGLFDAEGKAADQAVKYGAAQKSLLETTIELGAGIDRDAAKLIEDRVQAENAGAARTVALRNEIAALRDKQKAESDLAAAEAASKAVREGGDAMAAQRAARATVEQEFYYKRIQLTKELQAAEEEEAKKKEALFQETLIFFREYQAEQQRNKDAAERLAEEETDLFQKSNEKRLDDEIKSMEKIRAAKVKYLEDTARMARQTSDAEISAREKTITEDADLQKSMVDLESLSAVKRIELTSAINARELQQKKDLEDEKLKVTMDSLEEQKRVLLGGQTEQQFTVNAGMTGDFESLTKLEDLNRKLEAAESEHVSKMKSLDDQLVINANRTYQQQIAAYEKIFAPVTRALDTTISGIMQGTLTVGEGFARMWNNIVISEAEALAKVLMGWVQHEAAVLLIHITTNEKKVAADQAAATQSKSISAMSSLSEIAHAAATAAAKAYQAMAGIPVVGPVLGAAAAAATFAAVMAFEALASAAGGMEVGAPQPVLVHAGEVITSAENIGMLAASPVARVDQDQISFLGPGSVVVPREHAGGVMSRISSPASIPSMPGTAAPFGLSFEPQRLSPGMAGMLSRMSSARDGMHIGTDLSLPAIGARAAGGSNVLSTTNTRNVRNSFRIEMHSHGGESMTGDDVVAAVRRALRTGELAE